MAKQPLYTWDENTGTASCIIYYDNLQFEGTAICHPDDEDMKNRTTGQIIAELRALKKLYQHQKNNEIKPRLAALKQLYYSMNKSKKFNPKAYENKMLYRQIQNLEFDLDIIKQNLVQLEINLRGYLAGKEELYTILRKQREAKTN